MGLSTHEQKCIVTFLCVLILRGKSGLGLLVGARFLLEEDHIQLSCTTGSCIFSEDTMDCWIVITMTCIDMIQVCEFYLYRF